jgi:deazaflavin-dependent oxidoreductase (nitroreductase family)
MPAPYPSPWRPSRLHPTRWLAVRLGGLPWLPRLAPYIVRADLLLRRLTGGRITLLTFAGMPELFLTVAGRKTGQLRTTPLLCVPRDGSWLVAGSNWGGPKPPAWVGNLAAADIAEVGFHGRSTDVEARLLEGDERAAAWREMLVVWPNYAKYAERTDRRIPVFRLTPVTQLY